MTGADANHVTPPSGPLYPRLTRRAALIVLACGWAIPALMLAIQAQPTSAMIVAWIGVQYLLPAAAICILAASLPHGDRANHLWYYALVPCLGAAVFIALLGVPAFELVSPMGGPMADFWDGIHGLVWSIYAAITLYGPQQFLWRTVSRRQRALAIMLSTAPPLAALLPFKLPVDTLDVIVTSVGILTIAGLAAWIAEWIRAAIETDEGLRPRPFTLEEPVVTSAYERESNNDIRLVGVALSGGGYRASLFTLGALMYVHDACARTEGIARRIAAVSSVSGGSVTNAVVGHRVALGTGDRGAVDWVARALIAHVVREGSMFGGRASLYYFLLLPLTALGFAGLIWLTIHHITWGVIWRSIAIPCSFWIIVTIFIWSAELLDRVKSSAISTTLWTANLALWLGAAGVTLHFVLSMPAWRLAVSWTAAALFALAAGCIVWTLRGTLIGHTFQKLLDRVTASSRLVDLRPETHHIFCATEVQFDETAYFARDAIRARSFEVVGPGNLPTAVAMRASAALPGAFPPVILRGLKGSRHAGVDDRDEKRYVASSHMALVDGGVRDNLGASWFTNWAPLVDELLVVSAAPNRRQLRRISNLPGLSELFALLNLIDIPYSTRERLSRRALIPILCGTHGATAGMIKGGALCHIEDSPYDLANRFKSPVRSDGRLAFAVGDVTGLPDWQVDQIIMAQLLKDTAGGDIDHLTARATAVLEHLRDLERNLPDPPEVTQREHFSVLGTLAIRSRQFGDEPWIAEDAQVAWWKRTQQSAIVGTKLSRIEPSAAMNLVLHGYYLAMANLHIVLDWPLLKDLDTVRLQTLFDGLVFGAAAPAPKQAAKLERLQRRPLRSIYVALMFVPLSVTVREEGEFADKTAAALVGLDPQGRKELMGLWMVPTMARAGGIDTWLTRIEERDAAVRRFWGDVVADLERRGLKDLVVSCQDPPEIAWRGRSDFLGLDEAIEKIYAHALMLPRPSALAHEARSSYLTIDVKKDVEGVLRAASEVVALACLDRLEERCGAKYAKTPELLRKAWPRFVKIFGLPDRLRCALLDMDAETDATADAIRDRLRDRGAFSSDQAALIFVQEELERKGARWPRVSDWRAVCCDLTTAYPGRLSER